MPFHPELPASINFSVEDQAAIETEITKDYRGGFTDMMIGILRAAEDEGNMQSVVGVKGVEPWVGSIYAFATEWGDAEFGGGAIHGHIRRRVSLVLSDAANDFRCDIHVGTQTKTNGGSNYNVDWALRLTEYDLTSPQRNGQGERTQRSIDAFEIRDRQALLSALYAMRANPSGE